MYLQSNHQSKLIINKFVQKKKIVLVDEATANIDLNTEQIIQELMNEEFKDSTMITVAHRLNTVIKSDKILVMGFGKVIEFDTPQRLMNDPNSEFYSLMQQFNN